MTILICLSLMFISLHSLMSLLDHQYYCMAAIKLLKKKTAQEDNREKY